MTLMKLRSRNLVPEAGDIGRQNYKKGKLKVPNLWKYKRFFKSAQY